MDRPLAGVSVVAFEQALAMPFGSWILAEMGADVVKLERPGRGDVIRGWDSAVRGLSTGFAWVNGGKRDVAVDMSRPEGREVVRRLALRADVFLENFAPGVAAKMGLAFGDLAAGNPRLIYCSLSGYGQTGPYRRRKAYDVLVQGEGGLILTTGYPETPAKIGLPITDLLAGTYAALGVSLALRERERTGKGQYLDVAMFDAVASWLGYYPQHYWHGGGEPPRTGMRHQYLVPYGPYLAADGKYVNVVVASDENWRSFCEQVVHKPEWLAEPRFGTVERRTASRADLEPLIESEFAAQPASLWLERLEAAGLAYGEVRGIADVLQHPQVLARNLVATQTSPVGELPMIRFPLAPPDAPRHLPGLGEHTDQVLREAGYSGEEISRMRADRLLSGGASSGQRSRGHAARPSGRPSRGQQTPEESTARLIADRLAGVAPSRLLVAADFDGTLAEIVAEPASARLLPEAESAVRRLLPLVLKVAVISGRPQAFLRRQLPFEGVTLLGDYGQVRPRPDARTRLHRFIAEASAAVTQEPGARLEAKPASISLHFREAPEAGERLASQLSPIAERLGLDLRRGRLVLEVMPAEAGKAQALRRLVKRLGPGAAVFCGDDRGDRPAFELLSASRLPHLAVGVASEEVDRGIFAACDLVLEGPRMAARFLTELADWAEGRPP